MRIPEGLTLKPRIEHEDFNGEWGSCFHYALWTPKNYCWAELTGQEAEERFPVVVAALELAMEYQDTPAFAARVAEIRAELQKGMAGCEEWERELDAKYPDSVDP